MAINSESASPSRRGGADPNDLLRPSFNRDLVDWPAIREQKVFYVQGLQRVLAPISRKADDLYRRNDELTREIENRPGWRDALSHVLFKRVARKQIIDAIQARPLRFDKAAEVVLLADLVAKEQGDARSIFETVSIVPAVFSIEGFNRDTLVRLRQDDSNRPEPALEILRSLTGQAETRVFYEIADGGTQPSAISVQPKPSVERPNPVHFSGGRSVCAHGAGEVLGAEPG